MTGALRRPTRVGEDEYFAFEQSSSVRHELIGGVIYAMVGGSDRHNLICGNIFAALHAHVSPPCQVFSAQMKLRVETVDDVDVFYPDILVSCDTSDRQPLYRERPCLVFEVLSEGTEKVDRTTKLYAYRQIASLQEYALVAQDVPQIELLCRRTAWKPQFLFLEDTCRLDSVGLQLPLREIYRNIPF